MAIEYYKTKESVKEYIQLAKDVNGKELIIILDKYLSPGTEVLEIGSGPGSDWEILSKRYKVIGSDNSVEFLNHLKTKYPKGKFIELDAVTLATKESFDAIYSNKVLHHLKDNELGQSIKRQSQILNKNGIICHSFWKGEGNETFKGMFVNYHTANELKEIFEPYFDLVILEDYKEFEDNDSLLLIGKKK